MCSYENSLHLDAMREANQNLDREATLQQEEDGRQEVYKQKVAFNDTFYCFIYLTREWLIVTFGDSDAELNLEHFKHTYVGYFYEKCVPSRVVHTPCQMPKKQAHVSRWIRVENFQTAVPLIE